MLRDVIEQHIQSAISLNEFKGEWKALKQIEPEILTYIRYVIIAIKTGIKYNL